MATPGGETFYRPGEAGRAVGVQPSTLRVYAQRFAELLSDDATAADRPGYRVYSERDVAILKQARALLERGFTYERAAAELRPATGRAGSRAARREPASRAGGDTHLSEQLAALQGAVTAWRALAEERAAEIAQMREELRQLRELVMASRRPAPASRLRHR